ncbi:peptidoglycan/xylan/chitin deacetylase (PgdA/CDA1 family) [Sinobaca qinghaiensis]|uniref:Peptidoglycan/xylan/chitin deacetylase (PgdA/CDA1 family) n=1 Tax=Sinobaca qinghaiensis TaxID=342944 RepID=A0A419V7W2_9BACL|nr:polysaccharide deacetylase family protein [Sinobaca qinghaiensis]RKD76009.1 peptidoglycan/xylan/chitin deacetylase (PgdA/CDA1 family) [Sinobaca qinghaiensis]
MTNAASLAPAEKKAVFLTFDDGPSRTTHQILDILKDKQAKAAFFWQGRLVHPQRPARRVIEEGHTLGSHTHRHPNLTSLSFDKQKHEIQSSLDSIKSISPAPVEYFRPPYGRYNEETVRVVNELGLELVMWDTASFDWKEKKSPEAILSNVMDTIQPGSIVLLHELQQTVSILPELIDLIHKEGYTCLALPSQRSG